MSRRQWALVAVLVLVNYIIFASLFTVVFTGRTGLAEPTRTPAPTFSPVPSPTPLPVLPSSTPSPTPPPATPTVFLPTATPTSPTQAPTAPPSEVAGSGASVAIDVSMNVRAGPGTNYETVGALAPGDTAAITGKNADGSWWQIRHVGAPNDAGWISAAYGDASNIENVPVVEAPAPPTDAPTTAPPTEAATEVPETPQYQFSPGAWYSGDRNDAIGRFYGHIKDGATGAMVNGYNVRATCGDFAVLSYPSGPSGVASDWEPGWYDIVIPDPVSCSWTLQVVQYQCDSPGFDAQCTQYTPLSEAVSVTTDVAAGETIIVADWIKNW